MIYVCVEPNRTEPNKYSILLIIGSLTLLLLIVGCAPAQQQELAVEEDGEVPSPPPPPPAPSSPGLAGKAYANVDGEQVCYTDEQLQNLFAQNPELQALNLGAKDVVAADWSARLLANEGTYANLTANHIQWVYSTAYVLKNCDEWIAMSLLPGPPVLVNTVVDGQNRQQAHLPHFFRGTPWITINGRALDNQQQWSLAGFYTRQGATVEEPTSGTSEGELLFIDDSWEKGALQYVAMYACNRDADGFNCHDGKWVINSFEVDSTTPPLRNIHILEGPNEASISRFRNEANTVEGLRIRDRFSPTDRIVALDGYPSGTDVSGMEVWMTSSQMVVNNALDYLSWIGLPAGEQRGAIICPDARTVDDVVPGCQNEIRYTHEQCTQRGSPCSYTNYNSLVQRYIITFNSGVNSIEEHDGFVGVALGPDPCANGIQDGDETDVDCGGACGATCQDGDACVADADCASNICDDNACLVLPEVGAPGPVPG